ncbi:hypothetical protein JYB64_26770, partial [Algoriphagus aestuarii]|nr:hypothetical protein [Algoriphagus aestuarii]
LVDTRRHEKRPARLPGHVREAFNEVPGELPGMQQGKGSGAIGRSQRPAPLDVSGLTRSG